MKEDCSTESVDPGSTKHFYYICTMLAQRLRRWSNIVQMLCKCFVFSGFKLSISYLHVQVLGCVCVCLSSRLQCFYLPFYLSATSLFVSLIYLCRCRAAPRGTTPGRSDQYRDGMPHMLRGPDMPSTTANINALQSQAVTSHL